MSAAPSEESYALVSAKANSIAAPILDYQPPQPRTYAPRIALIGAGGISFAHLVAYRKAGFDVAAICGRTLEKAEARRNEFFPQADVTADFDALLNRGDIGVFDITTHPAERLPLMEKALNAGKHVLSQKPFVLDLDTGLRLADLADTKGVKLAVNQNGRWAPYVRYAQLAIDRGLIGEVQSLTVNVCWDHGWVAGTPFDRIHHLLLFDFAVHWVDMACCFMGRPPRTAHAMLTKGPGQKVTPPLIGSAQLAFDAGLATFHFDGCTKCGAFESIQIIGTKGRISATGKPLEAHHLELITSEGIARPNLEGHWMPDGFGGTMGELLCAIDENRQPYHSAAHNLRSLEAVFALIASADEGRTVRVGEARNVGANCQIQP